MESKQNSRPQMSTEELCTEILRRLLELSVQDLIELDQFLDSLDTDAGTTTDIRPGP